MLDKRPKLRLVGERKRNLNLVMHPIFLNKDVVVQLCRLLDSRHALTILARTASLFFHPATDVIWKSKSDIFVDLLKTFGEPVHYSVLHKIYDPSSLTAIDSRNLTNTKHWVL